MLDELAGKQAASLGLLRGGDPRHTAVMVRLRNLRSAADRGRRLVCSAILSCSCVLAAATAAAQPAAPAGSCLSAPATDTISRASPAASTTKQPVAVAGSFDGAKARARNQQRLAADRAPIVLLRGDSVLELGRRLCEQVVPRRPADTPILLKPNLGGFDWFKKIKQPGDDDGIRGRITQPEFVRGVIKCLKARGHTRITIADGWDSPHADWKRLVRLSGYEEMARAEGVALYALDDDGVFDVEGEQPAKPLAVTGMEHTQVPTLLIPRILARHLEHGLVISLPKLKAHRFGVVSIALKGMQGFVMMSDGAPAHRQKSRMHREVNRYLRARKQGIPETPAERAEYVAALQTFAERLSDVVAVEAPDVVLVDAAPAMGGDGFQKLFPQTGLYALGGTNPILVDRIGAELLGLWDNAPLARQLGGHRTSPILETAARRFGVDITAPALTGDGAARLREKQPVHYIAMAPFALHDGDGTSTQVAAAADAPVPVPRPGSLPAPLPSAAASVPPSAAPDRPVFHVAPTGDAAPIVDGRSDDAAWSRAPRVRFDTDYAGRTTGIFTTARFLYGKGTLYALFELEGAGLNVDASFPIEKERKDLYNEDCVELMVAPSPAEPWRFYEMELGPLGHFYDLELDRKARPSERPQWSSAVRVVATHDPATRRATIEAAFAAPELAQLIAPGATVLAGIFRVEGKSPRHYLAWRPARTAKPNFHVPEAFGLMQFDRAPSN